MTIIDLFKPVSTFVFDMDGVLTDGTLLVMSGNEWLRRMHIKDGYALQLAVKKNYRVVVISKSYSEPVKDRLHLLGVKDVFMRISDKRGKLEEYMKEHGLTPGEVIFMGDDMPDYPCMQVAGVPCCPADAAADLKLVARYISPFKGGEGCARDVIEKVLKLQGNWTISND